VRKFSSLLFANSVKAVKIRYKAEQIEKSFLVFSFQKTLSAQKPFLRIVDTDMPKKSPKKKVLSLFSGCGGMDIGFEGGFSVKRECVNEKIHKDWEDRNESDKDWIGLEKTDFETVFANDILPYAKVAWNSYFDKHPESRFHVESIVGLVKKHREGDSPFPAGIDVVTGGFPCNDFSVAGYRKGFNSHKSHQGNPLTSLDKPTTENRGLLYMWMREVVEIVQPKVFVAENVKGLVSLSDAKTVIENDFRNIGDGYIVIDAKVLHAGDFGVPQSRERVFFIGLNRNHLKKEAIKQLTCPDGDPSFSPYPEPTHDANPPDGTNLAHHVNCLLALNDLPEPDPKDKDIPEDQQAYSKAKWYGKHCQGQIEIKKDGLGPTIRAEHHGNIEFRRLSTNHGGEGLKGKKERRLTVRECARIQTFPDKYEFIREGVKSSEKVSASDAYRLIGNAVPPLLAYHLARRLQDLWGKLFLERPRKPPK